MRSNLLTQLVLELKERKLNLKCMSEYQSIVRIVNRLVKDGYKFRMCESFVWQPSKEETSTRSRSRARTSKFGQLDDAEEFVHISNLPQSCTLGDIKEFMQGISVRPTDIAVIYDSDGNFLKEAIIRIHSTADLSLALEYSGRLLKDHCLTSKRFE